MKLPLHQIGSLLAKRTLTPNVDKQRLSQEIAAYLLDTGRTGELDSLARELIRYRAEQGVVEVSAVSAHRLSADILAAIQKRVQALYPAAKRIMINEVQNPAVIGGVRLELVDRQLDLSIRTKL